MSDKIQRWAKPHKVFIPSEHGRWCKSSDVTHLEEALSEASKYNDKLKEENEKLKKAEDTIATTYEYLRQLSNSINNTGWERRHSRQIRLIHDAQRVITSEWEELLP